MIDLIKSETYKLKKTLLFKVLFIFYLVSIILLEVEFVSSSVTLDFDNAEDELAGTIKSILGEIPQNATNTNSVYFIFFMAIVLGIISAICIIPVFSSMYISMEYNTRSIQQIVGKGISRSKFIISKFLVMAIMVDGIIIVATLVGFILNTIVFGFGNCLGYLPNGIMFLIKILLMNAVFIAISSLVAYMFKGSNASMPVGFLTVTYIFSSLGEVIIGENNIICIAVFIAAIIVLLGSTILWFEKSDLN